MRALVCFSLLLVACGGQTSGGDPLPHAEDSGATNDTSEPADTTPAGDTGTPVPDGPPPVTDPITAPDEAWTWVPIKGTQCANGTETGIGVNLTKRSKKAFVYLMGGGACWDALSCGVPLAANLDGYADAKFQSDMKKYGSVGVFDRTDEKNPFRDYSFFFIPYCTGDVHAGSKIAEYGGKKYNHVGYLNVGYDFARIVPTMKGLGVDYAVLAGSSAGGFGALWNFARFQDALGSATHVDAIDDGGPPLRPPYMPTNLQETWTSSWGLDLTIPSGCPKCTAKDGYHNAIDFFTTKYPGHRASLLSSYQDNVIRNYFGLSGAKMEEGLKDFADNVVAKAPDWRVFYTPGQKHVFLGDRLSALTSGGVTLADFLTKQVTKDTTWTSVRP